MTVLNWRKGLFRLWLVVSLVWAAAIFALDRPDTLVRRHMALSRALERAEVLANSPSDPVTLPSGTLSTRAAVAVDVTRLKQAQAEREKTFRESLAVYGWLTFGPIIASLVLGLLSRWILIGFLKREET